MLTRIIEATNEQMNWGKFMVGRFSREEMEHQSKVDPGSSVVRGRGLTSKHIMVMDLQTGEAALFEPRGLAKADLNKHAIWVCPLFEPFLEWLYEQDLSPEGFEKLPALIEFSLSEAEFQLRGYRRNPDLVTIQTDAHGKGQEQVLDDLSDFALRLMENPACSKMPVYPILSDLRDGSWLERLEMMRTEAEIGETG